MTPVSETRPGREGGHKCTYVGAPEEDEEEAALEEVDVETGTTLDVDVLAACTELMGDEERLAQPGTRDKRESSHVERTVLEDTGALDVVVDGTNTELEEVEAELMVVVVL